MLEQWCIDEAGVRRRMYRAPTPRERERWHGVWLLAQGWTAAAVGRALERDAHTIGRWVKAFAEGGPKALVFEQTGGSPALDVEQRGEVSRSSCLNYLHRLRFVLKRPKRRLVKADPARREAFVWEYAALTVAAARTTMIRAACANRCPTSARR